MKKFLLMVAEPVFECHSYNAELDLFRLRLGEKGQALRPWRLLFLHGCLWDGEL
jgi:hypothetical protein